MVVTFCQWYFYLHFSHWKPSGNLIIFQEKIREFDDQFPVGTTVGTTVPEIVLIILIWLVRFVHRLAALQRELKMKELQLMDATRQKFLTYQQQQKEAELTRLDDEIRRKVSLESKQNYTLFFFWSHFVNWSKGIEIFIIIYCQIN